MIEKSPLTANIARIRPSRDLAESLVSSLKENSYTSEASSGFSIESSDSNTIEAYLIEQSYINVQNFDPDSKRIIEDQNKKTTIIPFRINTKSGFLYVFSNQSNLTKVISRIGESVRWEFPLDEVLLDIEEIYRCFVENKSVTKLTSVKLRNFQTDSGFVGTYSVKSGGEGNISDLAKQNGQNVVVLRGEFEIGEQTAKLGIYRTGTIQLYNHIEKEDEFWSQIEGTITKGAIE